MKPLATFYLGMLALTLTVIPNPTRSQTATGRVVINEYMPWPGNSCSTTAEFIELFNMGPGAVDIGCYVITDGDFSVTIPAGTVLEPGQFYILAGQSVIYAPCANLLQSITADLNWNTCNCTNGPIPVTGEGFLSDGGAASEQVVLMNPQGKVVDAVVRALPPELSATISTRNSAGCAGFTFDLDLMRIAYETIGESTGRGNSIARKLDGDCGWLKDTQQSGGSSNNTLSSTSSFTLSMYITEEINCNGGTARFVVNQAPADFWFPIDYILAYDVNGDGLFGPGDQFTSGTDSTAPDLTIPNLPLGYYSINIGPRQQCSYQNFTFSIGPCGVLGFRLHEFMAMGAQTSTRFSASISGADELTGIQLEGSFNGRDFYPVQELNFEPTATLQQVQGSISGQQFGYYRLLMEDKFKKTTYSAIKTVSANKPSPQFSLVGNPVTEAFQVMVASPSSASIRIVVMDSYGREVMTQREAISAGFRQLTIPATQLPSGIYILQISTEQGFVRSLRAVKRG